MTPSTRLDCHDTPRTPSLITVSSKGTGRRTIRVDPDLWDEFALAADRAKTDRSTLIRDFISWMLRKPDARAPEQIPPDSEQGASTS